MLIERQEKPDPADLVTGAIRIVSKVSFNDGQLVLRGGGDTKTGMILVRPGDLLVSGINAAKGAIAVYDKKNTAPIAATIHYGAYSVNEDRAYLPFIWYLLRSQTFRDLLLQYVPGGIKTELKAKRLLPVPIPLPMVDEQRRIVARIEELAAKIEEARQLRRRSNEEFDIMQNKAIGELFSGLPAKGKFSEVLLSPPRNGWSCRCDNMDGGTAVLALSSVTGFNYRSDKIKRTSEATVVNAHYWLRPGDLLMTRSNTPELVGHVAIYNGTPAPCIFPDLIMRLEINEQLVSSEFTHLWLRSPKVREFIMANAKGTSPSMKKISQVVVNNIPFPVGVSVDQQKDILRLYDVLYAKADALKALQAQSAAELAALLPSVLDKAFMGEL